MIVNVYSMFDRKAKSYGVLIQFANDDIAKRGCAELMLAGGDHPVIKYADDFDLYLVSRFDNETGLLDVLQPTIVCRMSDFQHSEYRRQPFSAEEV